MLVKIHGHTWACVLTPAYKHEIDEKKVEILHPVNYMSGLFHCSKMKYAALNEEAYVSTCQLRN